MESVLMAGTGRTLVSAALALAVAGVWFAPAQAQDKPARIVCWKDKSGKVVGCGDKVPLEFQDSAQREMDRRGVTRSTTESAEEAARRRAQEQDAAKQKQEDAKRLAEQRRQDAALLNTFSSDKEIDQKRDRDLQQLELQLSQLKVSLKNAAERYTDAKSRSDASSKDKKTADMLKEDIRKSYAEQKKRYLELRGEAAGEARVERAR